MAKMKKYGIYHSEEVQNSVSKKCPLRTLQDTPYFQGCYYTVSNSEHSLKVHQFFKILENAKGNL